jgi:16S rRNA (cytosine1402-N4)-methyltransferase
LPIWLNKSWEMILTMSYHNPVLLQEAVEGLNIAPDGIYVDVTFGGGGHSRAILDQLGPHGKLIAFDQDIDALDNKLDDERFLLIHQNFRHAKRFLRFHGFDQIDGLLADLGVSSHQFDQADRGFSTRFNGTLDMRMNQSENVSAMEVVNQFDEAQLRYIFKEYGELHQANLLAGNIVRARVTKSIETTEELNNLVRRLVPGKRENKVLAQIYQAIRIEVNQEIDALKELLLQLPALVKPGGRISFMSYHSLEDRLVKRFIRNGMFEGEAEKDLFGNTTVPFFKVGQMIVPSDAEIAENGRARSAKLRIAERYSN